MEFKNLSDSETTTFSQNFKKAIEDVAQMLSNKKYVLLQSNPGMGRTYLSKEAAKSVGLNIVEFESSANINFHPSISTKEEVIIKMLSDEKASAILVSLMPGDDIDVFLNVAKQTNLPLIASVSHLRDYLPTITITPFDNLVEMKSALNELPLTKNENITDRVNSVRSNSYVVSPPKSGQIKSV